MLHDFEYIAALAAAKRSGHIIHRLSNLEFVVTHIVSTLFHLATIHEDIGTAYMTIVQLFRPAVSLMYNNAT